MARKESVSEGGGDECPGEAHSTDEDPIEEAEIHDVLRNERRRRTIEHLREEPARSHCATSRKRSPPKLARPRPHATSARASTTPCTRPTFRSSIRWASCVTTVTERTSISTGAPVRSTSTWRSSPSTGSPGVNTTGVWGICAVFDRRERDRRAAARRGQFPTRRECLPRGDRRVDRLPALDASLAVPTPARVKSGPALALTLTSVLERKPEPKPRPGAGVRFRPGASPADRHTRFFADEYRVLGR